ncbi:MAG: hypothetical protein AAFY17_13675, partial [Cyanobacteria bacterium J06642_11]
VPRREKSAALAVSPIPSVVTIAPVTTPIRADNGFIFWVLFKKLLKRLTVAPNFFTGPGGNTDDTYRLLAENGIKATTVEI